MDSPSRADAWQLLTEWSPSEALRKHGLAVEATVAWYGANRFAIAGPELETWRIAGLLHDFDYERFPETHPMRGAEELRRLGYPEVVVEAVLGHGDHTGVPRTSLAGEDRLRLRRALGLRDCRGLRSAEPEPRRSGPARRRQEDEGQRLRPTGPPRPAHARRRGARGPVRGTRRERGGRPQDHPRNARPLRRRGPRPAAAPRVHPAPSDRHIDPSS